MSCWEMATNLKSKKDLHPQGSAAAFSPYFACVPKNTHVQERGSHEEASQEEGHLEYPVIFQSLEMSPKHAFRMTCRFRK